MDLRGYFQQYPDIARRAWRMVRRLEAQRILSPGASSLLDFDACLAFMLPVRRAEQNLLAKQLRICREAVHLANRNRPIPRPLGHALESIVPTAVLRRMMAPTSVRRLRSRRTLRKDLRSSYVASVHRVGYRSQLIGIAPLAIDRADRRHLLACVERVSAFLLFDDDVVDLRSDLRARKATSLSEYVGKRGSLDVAIREMSQMLRRGKGTRIAAVDDFAAALLATYLRGGT